MRKLYNSLSRQRTRLQGDCTVQQGLSAVFEVLRAGWHHCAVDKRHPLGQSKMSGVLPPDHNGLIEVIDQTAYIENLMNQVIEGYCKPAQKRSVFFWSVLLDSSIMSLGGKVRAVSAIAQHLKFKVDASQIHNVLSLRNAFAHHKTSSYPLFVVGRTPDVGSAHYQLQIISSSGRVARKKREEALAEFRAAHQAAKANLEEFIRVVKEHNERDSV